MLAGAIEIAKTHFPALSDLMAPATIFSVDREYGVLPSDEIDVDDDLEIVHEYTPWH
ncbi:hypothetical protein [Rhizobium lentis]|uniref:Uncharacterized protein n=1 Tax=Rhizobium lentis TaxID=1138194 RepID=A0A7W8XJ27_9HYPH|nr:hypothetical protein [Rhizobium lentis]MBB4577273.1 hypothetical protein [Rhizobium lentis]MBB5553912.1 hypothetical protein [Rhizobium lentis]MBB5563828.1 hypothetical protein [Rhizobium lentis]MBB5570904.1 hypothetical protein [Rhizobium lentis]